MEHFLQLRTYVECNERSFMHIEDFKRLYSKYHFDYQQNVPKAWWREAETAFTRHGLKFGELHAIPYMRPKLCVVFGVRAKQNMQCDA